MNKKLFVIGDSFAEYRQDLNYLWQTSLYKELKTDLINIAENGASSNWLLSKLPWVDSNINVNDYLLLIVPYWERVCIWPESPDLTSLISFNQIGKSDFANKKWQHYTQDQRDAFESYFLYLKNDEFIMATYAALLHWINSIGSRLNTKPLIIFGFESKYDTQYLKNCAVAQGNLFDVGIEEFKDISTWDAIVDTAPFIDPRVGHLSDVNHEILSKKLVKYFIENQIPNLTSDFQKFFI